MFINRAFEDWTLVGGIDPGTRLVGGAILAVKGQEIQMVDIRSWKIVGETLEDRVNFVGASVEDWLPPGVKLTGVERGYIGKNPRTGLAIAMAGGVCLRAVRRAGGQAQLVDPSEARKAIGAARWGDRRAAAKERVQRVVTKLLRLKRVPTEDEADACTLAVWASNRVWKLA